MKYALDILIGIVLNLQIALNGIEILMMLILSIHEYGLCFQLFAFSFFKDFIYLFLERGEEKEKEGEKYHCVVAWQRQIPWCLKTFANLFLGPMLLNAGLEAQLGPSLIQPSPAEASISYGSLSASD